MSAKCLLSIPKFAKDWFWNFLFATCEMHNWVRKLEWNSHTSTTVSHGNSHMEEGCSGRTKELDFKREIISKLLQREKNVFNQIPVLKTGWCVKQVICTHPLLLCLRLDSAFTVTLVTTAIRFRTTSKIYSLIFIFI